jgi:hypothetical protein
VFFAFTFNVHGGVETASLIAIWLETENASCGKWYMALNNLILGNYFELS